MSLKKAQIIDFTGNLKGALAPNSSAHSRLNQFSAFGQEVISLLRNGHEEKLAVVIDSSVGLWPGEAPKPILITDHLNLTGFNPLVGPNDPVGERVPVVNDIYVFDFGSGPLSELKRGVAAGLKSGFRPSVDDLNLVKELGSDVCCYNLVPMMIVAAHAGWKLVAIVLPPKAKLDQNVISALTGES